MKRIATELLLERTAAEVDTVYQTTQVAFIVNAKIQYKLIEEAQTVPLKASSGNPINYGEFILHQKPQSIIIT